MNNLNSTLIEGNLLRDPEIKEHDGKRVCHIAIASNRYTERKGGSIDKEVSFFDIEVTGSPIENCLKKGHKGRGVRVVGRLRQDRWEEDGKPCSHIVIAATHIVFDPKGERK